MPGLNQKGPKGQGAMSGRKMGKCTNFGKNKNDQIENDEQSTENIPENGKGRGLGRGKGLGRGQGGLGMGMGRRFRHGDN
ncbi:MAG: DUF5320 domain-containing protein [Paludibacter sp.]|nr:DUF5320 domain-containing protein [Paludibacter sp.]